MKALILSIIAIVLCTTNSFAQDNKGKIKFDPSKLGTLDITRPSTSGQKASAIDFYFYGDNGQMKTDNENGTYYVLDYKGKTASELYTNILASVASIYKNPEKVLSKIENVSVTVSGFASDVEVKSDSYTYYYAFSYKLSFQFKDGRIRINAPSIDAQGVMFYNQFYDSYRTVSDFWAYRNLSRRNYAANISFSKYLNDLIVEIINKSETVNNW